MTFTACRAELRVHSFAEQTVSMPAIGDRRWTGAEVERLIEEREGLTPRYELADGELLVTPAPSGRHQRLVRHLDRALTAYLQRYPIGEVRLGPYTLELGADDRFEPDLAVVPALDGRLPPAADTRLHPLLICEVLSPGFSRHDCLTKRRSFQQYGVPEYWVIDGDAEAFEVWHPGDDRAALADDRVTWQPPGTAEAFELDLRKLFAGVADGAPLALSDRIE